MFHSWITGLYLRKLNAWRSVKMYTWFYGFTHASWAVPATYPLIYSKKERKGGNDRWENDCGIHSYVQQPRLVVSAKPIFHVRKPISLIAESRDAVLFAGVHRCQLWCRLPIDLISLIAEPHEAQNLMRLFACVHQRRPRLAYTNFDASYRPVTWYFPMCTSLSVEAAARNAS